MTEALRKYDWPEDSVEQDSGFFLNINVADLSLLDLEGVIFAQNVLHPTDKKSHLATHNTRVTIASLERLQKFGYTKVEVYDLKDKNNLSPQPLVNPSVYQFIYQKDMSLDSYTENAYQSIKNLLEIAEDEEVISKIQEGVSENIKALIDKSIKGNKEFHFAYQANRTSVEKVLENISNNKDLKREALGLHILGNRYDHTAEHSVEVMLTALKIGRNIGLSESELLDLGTAALSHDIGKALIPKEVLMYKGNLRINKEAWKIMQMHDELGYEILKGKSMISARVARDHHPESKEQEIDLYSIITAIADIQVALMDGVKREHYMSNRTKLEGVILWNVELQKKFSFNQEYKTENGKVITAANIYKEAYNDFVGGDVLLNKGVAFDLPFSQIEELGLARKEAVYDKNGDLVMKDIFYYAVPSYVRDSKVQAKIYQKTKGREKNLSIDKDVTHTAIQKDKNSHVGMIGNDHSGFHVIMDLTQDIKFPVELLTEEERKNKEYIEKRKS